MKQNHSPFLSWLFFVFLFLNCTSQAFFCSTICAPTGCSGVTPNQCNSNCSPNWINTGTTCTVDPLSKYSLINYSNDLYTLNGTITISPSSKDNCNGDYSYFGNILCSDTATIALSTGIGQPHYAFEISVWIMMLDSSSWNAGQNIIIGFNGQQYVDLSNWNAKQIVCNSVQQSFYKLIYAYSHQNQTSTAISITIKTDCVNPVCKWGLKEAVIIAKLCDSTCLNCYGSTSTQCYACRTGSFLSNNTCSASCLTQFGSVTSSNVCVYCDLKCSVCSQNATFCSSCTTNGTYQAYLSGTTCTETCPTTTFANSSNHQCSSCPSHCDACSSATLCTTCTTGYAWLNSTCYSTCPNGTFLLNSTNCSVCDPKCMTCSGATASSCSSCTLNGTDKAYLLNTTCYATCPNATFPTTNPNLCNACDLKCTICSSNATSCTQCTTTVGPNQAYLDAANSKCVQICPLANTFANSANHICDACNINCTSCGTTSNNCYGCIVSMGWLNFTCYNPCPAGTFKDNSNCTLCNVLCQLCDVTAINCSLCTATAYLLNSTCYSLCPNPYFGDNNGGLGPNTCLTCNESCASCTGPTNTQCLSCNTTFMLSNFTCSNSCLPGFGITADPLICVFCSLQCLTCQMGNTNCTSCNNTGSTIYYLLPLGGGAHSCTTSCPIKYFINTTTMACDPCPIGCTSCTNNTFCPECQYASSFAWLQNLCYNPCPINSYKSNSTNCTRCQSQCTHCTNVYNNCTSCFTSGSQRAFLDGNICYKTCPAPTYGNTGSNTCQPCNIACDVCYGGGANQCTICGAGYILSGNTCSNTSCIAGYGVTLDPFVCVKCNLTCTQCAYININCSVCQTTGNNSAFLYQDPALTYTKCMVFCPSGLYGNNSTRTCDPCSIGCLTCQNISTNCQSCNTTYGLLNSTCLNPCPIGLYLNGTNCSNCSTNCLECSGTNTTCISCHFNSTNKTYLLNNTCLTACPINYLQFDNNTLGPTLCLSCNSSCSNCSFDVNNCTYCKSGFYLYNSTCIAICPTDFFAYIPNRQCINISSVGVNLTLSMYLQNSLNQRVFIDLLFNYDLDTSTFPITVFQTITTSNPQVTINMFDLSYVWLTNSSYRIIMQPKSYIYLYNTTFTVTTMALPSPVHQSMSGVTFFATVYGQTASVVWFLIKGPEMSPFQKQIVNGLASTSSKIRQFTTLPGIQQFNKAGLLSLLFAGAQITSSAIVVNSVHAQNFYEGSRFWANFIYFQVPNWEENKNKTKYVFSPSADQLAANSRLLSPNRLIFQTSSVFWRFERTGFTTFFIYDCYMQIILIILCWILVFIGKKLQTSYKWKILPKIYNIFHRLHQLTIFYFSMGMVLQWLYFDSSSLQRIISLAVCLAFNLYYLIYQLYMYYEMIDYSKLQLGTDQYIKMATKYGYFLRNIRYEEYEDFVRWSPKHWFRPYNYHLLSYYKKFLMIFALPLFYNYPKCQVGILIFLQLFQITRFCIVWPFASKRRNIFRLTLEIVLCVFFICNLLLHLLVTQIEQNNSNLIESQTSLYYLVGWIGVAAIFIFNLSFFALLLIDLILSCRKSHKDNMREIRRDYYYQKISKYQNSNQHHIDMQTLDAWVKKGDLNQKWIEDERFNQTIDITIQKYTVNKMGEGFTVQIDKITELVMGHANVQGIKHKMKVKEQVTGIIGLTRSININLYNIIKQIYDKFDPNFLSDYCIIKIIAGIDLCKYKQEQQIDINDETLIQTISFVYPSDKKQTHRFAVPMKGFPINLELLRPLIGNNQLKRSHI